SGRRTAARPATHPTSQFWRGPAAPAATQGWGVPPGPGAGHQAPGVPEQPKKDHHGVLRWTAGLLAAVLLAGGGAIAGMRLAGHASPAASGGAAPGPADPATFTQQAGALLNETLNNASAPGALTAAGTMLTGGAGAAAAGAQAAPGRKAPAGAKARPAAPPAR